MADMYGGTFGLSQMGAAMGDRILAERDRDRQISREDRAFQLQQNQDTRAQRTTDSMLTDADRARKLAQAGLSAEAFDAEGFVYGQSPLTGTPDQPTYTEGGEKIAPMSKDAMVLTDPGAGQHAGHVMAPGAAFSAPSLGARSSGWKPGAPVPVVAPVGGPTGKTADNVAKGKAVWAVDHRALLSQATDYAAQAQQLQQALPSILAKNPYPPGEQADAWKVAIQRKVQAQVGAYRQAANDAHTKGVAAEGMFNGKQAFFHLRDGDFEGAKPYLDALNIPSDVFKDMKGSGDGRYILLRHGGKITAQEIQAMTMGTTEDQLKAAQKTAELVQKDMEIEADKAKARMQAGATMASAQEKTKAINELTALDKEYRDLQASDPTSPRLKDIENRVYNIKGMFNVDRNSQADANRAVKKEEGQANRESALTRSYVLATMGNSQGPAPTTSTNGGGGTAAFSAPVGTMPAHAAPSSPTAFARDGKGNRIALINGQWVPYKGN